MSLFIFLLFFNDSIHNYKDRCWENKKFIVVDKTTYFNNHLPFNKWYYYRNNKLIKIDSVIIKY